MSVRNCWLCGVNKLQAAVGWSGAGNGGVGDGAVEHLCSVWTVLRKEHHHDQTDDHHTNTCHQDDAGDEVFTTKPAAVRELQETGGGEDEHEGYGAQNPLRETQKHNSYTHLWMWLTAASFMLMNQQLTFSSSTIPRQS